MADLIPDNLELTLIFIQLQPAIQDRNYTLKITHIWSHTGLPEPSGKRNEEIDQLLIGNVLEASEFLRKHHVNSKDFLKIPVLVLELRKL